MARFRNEPIVSSRSKTLSPMWGLAATLKLCPAKTTRLSASLNITTCLPLGGIGLG